VKRLSVGADRDGRKRLLICTRSHVPHGGADRIVADLSRELPSRGWDVVVAVAHGDRFNRIERYRDAYPGLPVMALDARTGTRYARRHAVAEAIHRTRADVVLAMRVFDAYEAVAASKLAAGRPRLVVGLRAYEPSYLFDVALYADHIDLCVTSGSLIATACRELCGLPTDRIESIGGGVHEPLVRPSPRTNVIPLRLLYAGRFASEQKRILDFVPYVRGLDANGVSYTLDMVGEGPEEPVLRSELAPAIAAGRVRIHPWHTREELYESFYPRADVFVHFSAWEGMTIAPREAMAHGMVPVISRFLGCNSERLFIDGVNALCFTVGDVPSALASTRRLASEPGLLARLSSQAMRSQQGRYSFAGAMDAWAAVLDRCLESAPTTGRIPRIPEPARGRMSWLPLPDRAVDWLRRVSGRHMAHQSPGSEWPTASHLLQATDAERFLSFARALEESERRAAVAP
jgi:glycosyltransferase involved in cell wall biosynthesis